MTGEQSVDLIVGFAALVVALGVIWKKFLYPFWRAIDTMTEVGPVLLDVAHEFRPNNGHSLRDVVDRIETKADAAKIAAEEARTAAEEAHRVAAEAAAALSIQVRNVEQATVNDVTAGGRDAGGE